MKVGVWSRPYFERFGESGPLWSYSVPESRIQRLPQHRDRNPAQQVISYPVGLYNAQFKRVIDLVGGRDQLQIGPSSFESLRLMAQAELILSSGTSLQ